jgi:GTP-binding protein
LAKTSSKPGKTQHIVQFLVDERWYLVDLPGYGYAKISKDLRHQFGDMIQTYLMDREVMNCVFVLLDSRLPPQKIDLEFIEWLGVSAIPFCLAFTKTDKLKPKELVDNIANYKAKLLETWEELPDIFITSANDKLGRDEILNFIDGVIKTINSRERDF